MFICSSKEKVTYIPYGEKYMYILNISEDWKKIPINISNQYNASAMFHLKNYDLDNSPATISFYVVPKENKNYTFQNHIIDDQNTMKKYDSTVKITVLDKIVMEKRFSEIYLVETKNSDYVEIIVYINPQTNYYMTGVLN